MSTVNDHPKIYEDANRQTEHQTGGRNTKLDFDLVSKDIAATSTYIHLNPPEYITAAGYNSAEVLQF